MKKWFSLVLAGLLCLTSMAAFAEETFSFQTEQFTMEDGLTFILPTGWESGEITENMQQQGIFIYAEEKEMGYAYIAAVEPANVTAEALAEGLVETPGTFSKAEVMVNSHGQELVLFMTANGSTMGYCIPDSQGFLITFIYSRTDGQPLSPETDAALITLVSEGAAAVHFAKPE